MKKILLLTTLSLVGISVQAGNWRTEPNTARAEELARDYFWGNTKNVTKKDIRDAMRKFSTFLGWEHGIGRNRGPRRLSDLYSIVL